MEIFHESEFCPLTGLKYHSKSCHRESQTFQSIEVQRTSDKMTVRMTLKSMGVHRDAIQERWLLMCDRRAPIVSNLSKIDDQRVKKIVTGTRLATEWGKHTPRLHIDRSSILSILCSAFMSASQAARLAKSGFAPSRVTNILCAAGIGRRARNHRGSSCRPITLLAHLIRYCWQ